MGFESTTPLTRRPWPSLRHSAGAAQAQRSRRVQRPGWRRLLCQGQHMCVTRNCTIHNPSRLHHPSSSIKSSWVTSSSCSGAAVRTAGAESDASRSLFSGLRFALCHKTRSHPFLMKANFSKAGGAPRPGPAAQSAEPVSQQHVGSASSASARGHPLAALLMHPGFDPAPQVPKRQGS